MTKTEKKESKKEKKCPVCENSLSGFRNLSWAVAVSSRRVLIEPGVVWAVTVVVWSISASMWNVRASMWDVADTVSAVAASDYVGCHILYVGCCILYACFTGAMWDFTGDVWAVTSSIWDIAGCMHVVQALCRLFYPPCGMSLKKTGNEDIVFCSGYRTFTNIPRTCPSFTSRAHVDLRFDTRCSRPA